MCSLLPEKAVRAIPRGRNFVRRAKAPHPSEGRPARELSFQPLLSFPKVFAARIVEDQSETT